MRGVATICLVALVSVAQAAPDPRFPAKKYVEFLKRAMKVYETRTNSCITWVKRNQEANYVKFMPHEHGCGSSVGMQGGMQLINLATHCFGRFGTLLHEMLHTLGFYHEHSRTDRDDYITIMWGNIRKGKAHNFLKYPSNKVDPFNVSYDYGSVMHYSPYAFTGNGFWTIAPKDPNASIGQRVRLSDKDVRKVMNMYNC